MPINLNKRDEKRRGAGDVLKDFKEAVSKFEIVSF